MRAISWNVHGLPFVSAEPEARMDAIAWRISGEKPDFVLLQEVWRESYLERIARGLGSDYACVRSTAVRFGWLRSGLAIFVRRHRGWRVEASTFSAFRSSASRWRLHEGDGIAGKGYLVLRLARGSERLTLLDTHLQAQYPQYRRCYARTRREQAAQLRRTVSALFGTEPALIAGDFNTAPSDPIFSSEIEPLGVEMTRDERAESGAGTAILPGDGRRVWIDYVFGRGLRLGPGGSRAVRISNRAADDPYSDHDGLLVPFEIG